jgi:3-polyprenyl-4-hydroxybenzoate decarboxylase
MENVHLLQVAEPLVLALLQSDYPQIQRLSYFTEGAFHGCVLLAIAAGGPLRPLELARNLWQAGPLQRSRLMVLVGAEQQALQGSALFWRVINQAEPQADILVSKGRLAIDATQKQDWPAVSQDADILARVARRWKDYGLDR